MNAIVNQKKVDLKVGDKVLISPQVTHKTKWIPGTIIDIEKNPFVGIVVSAETEDADVFFDKEYLFKKDNP